MKIADDAQSIKARMEEIQRERMQAIMGQPIEETKAVETYLAGEDVVWTAFSGYDCG